MITKNSISFAAGFAACGVVLLLGAAPDQAQPVDMAAMMAKAAQYTQPGPNHAVLEKFIGEWETETTLLIPGQKAKKEMGTHKFQWLMKGRWLQRSGAGSLAGMPVEMFGLIGYDNFKQSFVSTDVSSMDTAMNRAEGDMDPGGKALVFYGTIDEYLTGEHDKAVKYVWRFEDANKMVLEVHDLPIGLNNTKVVEVVFRRKK
jgi:hypothetical protein